MWKYSFASVSYTHLDVYKRQDGDKVEQAGKKTQEDLNKQLKEELSTEKKSPDELIKLLTEYINMSEAA